MPPYWSISVPGLISALTVAWRVVFTYFQLAVIADWVKWGYNFFFFQASATVFAEKNIILTQTSLDSSAGRWIAQVNVFVRKSQNSLNFHHKCLQVTTWYVYTSIDGNPLILTAWAEVVNALVEECMLKKISPILNPHGSYMATSLRFPTHPLDHEWQVFLI